MRNFGTFAFFFEKLEKIWFQVWNFAKFQTWNRIFFWFCKKSCECSKINENYLLWALSLNWANFKQKKHLLGSVCQSLLSLTTRAIAQVYFELNLCQFRAKSLKKILTRSVSLLSTCLKRKSFIEYVILNFTKKFRYKIYQTCTINVIKKSTLIWSGDKFSEQNKKTQKLRKFKCSEFQLCNNSAKI